MLSVGCFDGNAATGKAREKLVQLIRALANNEFERLRRLEFMEADFQRDIHGRLPSLSGRIVQNYNYSYGRRRGLERAAAKRDSECHDRKP